MKRIICFLLIISSLFLTSCAGAEMSANSSLSTTSEAQGSDVSEKNVYTHFINKSIETKSKVIILDPVVETKTLYYFSKVDGDFYPFCFDPFCDHVNYDVLTYRTKCIGTMIKDPFRTGTSAKIFYINSRIYFVFFDKIYSCSEIATDLRVEVSFSDKMDYYEKMTEFIKSASAGGTSVLTDSFYYPIQSFERDQNTLLFIRIDEEGNIKQYAYDTVSKKLTDLKKKMTEKEKEIGATLYTHSFENGRVYMAAYTNVQKSSAGVGLNTYVEGDFKGYYVADYAFTFFEKTEYVPPVSFDFYAEDGHVCLNGKNEEKTVFDIVKIKYDNTNEILAENIVFVKTPISLYLTDDSYYFDFTDLVELGVDASYGGGRIKRYNNQNGKIYRLNLKTGTIQTVFDDLSYDSFKIIYLDEKKNFGLMTIQKYDVVDGFVSSRGGLLYQFDIDENGNFVNLERVLLN